MYHLLFKFSHSCRNSPLDNVYVWIFCEDYIAGSLTWLHSCERSGALFDDVHSWWMISHAIFWPFASIRTFRTLLVLNRQSTGLGTRVTFKNEAFPVSQLKNFSGLTQNLMHTRGSYGKEPFPTQLYGISRVIIVEHKEIVQRMTQ